LLAAASVGVGGTGAVGLENLKITVAVAVGSGVLVGRVGVMVAVGVKVGMARAVCVRAALAVCAIKVPIAFGSIVGMTGAALPGTHAMIVTSAANQSRYFVLRVVMIPFACASRRMRNHLTHLWPALRAYGLSTVMAVYGKHRGPSTLQVITWKPCWLGATASKITW